MLGGLTNVSSSVLFVLGLLSPWSLRQAHNCENICHDFREIYHQTILLLHEIPNFTYIHLPKYFILGSNMEDLHSECNRVLVDFHNPGTSFRPSSELITHNELLWIAVDVLAGVASTESAGGKIICSQVSKSEWSANVIYWPRSDQHQKSLDPWCITIACAIEFRKNKWFEFDINPNKQQFCCGKNSTNCQSRCFWMRKQAYCSKHSDAEH
jgi:hypothetical protein